MAYYREGCELLIGTGGRTKVTLFYDDIPSQFLYDVINRVVLESGTSITGEQSAQIIKYLKQRELEKNS